MRPGEPSSRDPRRRSAAPPRFGRWVILAIVAITGCADEPDRGREVARVRAHLEGAWRELGARTPPGLTADQAGQRAEVIRDLRRYIDAEQYPTNRISERRIPIFIDDDGVRCAMAALLEASGHGALVARIARTQNLAYNLHYLRYLRAESSSG